MILTAATLAILCSCGGQKTEAGDAQDSLVEVTPENPDELLDTAKVETLTPEETKVEMEKIQAKVESGEATEQEKTLWEKLKARYNDAKAASGKKTVKELNVYFQPENGMIYFTADGVEGSTNL